MLYSFKSILLAFVVCLVPSKAETIVYYDPVYVETPVEVYYDPIYVETPVEEVEVYDPIYVETPDVVLEVSEPEVMVLDIPMEVPEVMVLEVPEVIVLEVPEDEPEEPEDEPEDEPEGQTKGADIPLSGSGHGCGINRDCLSCQALEHSGCYWSDDNGCFQLPRGVKKVSQCSGIVEIGEIKATCGNYPTCESCTMQSGCVYYRGECTYSSGPSCRLDVLNCANAPEDCPSSFNAYTPKIPYKMEQLLSDPYHHYPSLASHSSHHYPSLASHRYPSLASHHYPSFPSHSLHQYGHNPFSTISTIPRRSSSHYYPKNLESAEIPRVSYSHITQSSSVEIPEIEIRERTPSVRTVSSKPRTITRTSTTPTYSHVPQWTTSGVPSTTVRSHYAPRDTIRTSTSYGVPYAPGGTVRWNQ